MSKMLSTAAVGALLIVTGAPGTAAAAPSKQAPVDVALAAPASVEQGAEFDYIARVSSGSTALDAVRLTDALPASVRYVHAVSELGSCSTSNGSVLCDIGSMPRRTTTTVRIRVQAVSAGTATNAIQVDGTSSGETRTGTASASTTVTAVTAAPVTERQAPGLEAEDGSEPGLQCGPGLVECFLKQRQYPSAGFMGRDLEGSVVTFTMNDGRHVCDVLAVPYYDFSCSPAAWDDVLPKLGEPAGDTTFTASFAGNAKYLPASATARTTNDTGPAATPLDAGMEPLCNALEYMYTIRCW